jgi:uncharacterized protein (TIGR03435 family)
LTGLVFLTSAALAAPAWSQTAGTARAATPQFEVATIKPHPEGDHVSSIGGPPGRYEAKNVTVKKLVEEAFNLPGDQVTGGPPWAATQPFDVQAKIPDDLWQQMSKLDYARREQLMRPMLQSLLKERFQMAISHQPKKLLVYALVVSKSGAKVRPAGSAEPPPGTGAYMLGMDQKNIPISTLADFLARVLGRTVLDRTGLTDQYDITMRVPIPEQRSPDDTETGVVRALQEQLGLKLESTREVVDTLVIEHLEEPTAN